jgi:protease-4
MPESKIEVGLLTELAMEPWAMEPGRLQSLFLRVRDQAAAFAALAKVSIDRPKPALRVDGTIAMIPISGILMKQVPSWMAFFGIDGTAYSDIRDLVNQAADAKQVTAIHLVVDSPGGTVAGVADAAAAIRSARKQKPVTAHVQDLAASAAYWLTAQAERITADLNAEIGSIGVYTVYDDFSRFVANAGVVVHVIASGEHKGMGVFGAAITPAQIAAVREVIDGIAANFRDAVASGRGLSAAEVELLSTGQLWEAKAALAHKLIDGIGRPSAGQNPQSEIQNPKSQEGVPNVETTTQPQAAAPDIEKMKTEAAARERTRLTEMVAAFPKDPKFAMEQFSAGVTVQEAKAAYCDTLMNAQKPEPDEEGVAGTPGYQHGGYQGGSPGPGSAGGFLPAVRSYARERKCSRIAAIQAVRTESPDLYEKFRAESRPPMVHGRCKRVSVELGS